MSDGIRSVAQGWLGGSGSVPVVGTQGVRSIQAFWMGGAGSAPVTHSSGIRSLLAFWLGGAGASIGIPPLPPVLPLQGGGRTLRAQFRREETDEQKRLRREAQGIIERIKAAEPDQLAAIRADAADVSVRLRQTVVALKYAAAEYQARLNAEAADRAIAEQQAAREQIMAIQAGLDAAVAQIEELDAVFVMFMLAAQL